MWFSTLSPLFLTSSFSFCRSLQLQLSSCCSWLCVTFPTPDPKIDLLLPETGKLQQADQGPLQQITKRAKCVLASANWFNLNAGWEQQRAGRLFPACARSHQDITSLPTAHFLTASNFRYQSYPWFGECRFKGAENTFWVMIFTPGKSISQSSSL